MLITFELFLAFWLVSKFKQDSARCFAIWAFLVFGVFGIGKVVYGEKACGCFGVLEVPLLVTLVLDIGIIILSFLWPAKASVNRLPVCLAMISVMSIGVAF